MYMDKNEQRTKPISRHMSGVLDNPHGNDMHDIINAPVAGFRVQL